MNNYKLFLIDGVDYAEVDVEGLDFSTTFSVADIADISKRNDNLSKNIKLKKTKNNIRIFGNLDNLNRFTDSSINLNLGFNYKPSKKLDCLVYENDTLILKGQLQVLSGQGLTYEAVITGSIVNFFSLLGDKKLSDLDFTEYSHIYNADNIVNSFRTSIYKSGSTVPFKLGSGYVYPFIIYKPNDKSVNNVNNLIYYDNFRPAIYVKEYFNKIFSQPTLSGFTYELKGDTAFQDEFKSLIIPDSSENFINDYEIDPYVLELTKVTSSSGITGVGYTDIKTIRRLIKFDTVSNPANLISINTDTPIAETNCAFKMKRTILNASAQGSFNCYVFNNSGNNPVECYIEVSEFTPNPTGSTFSVIQKTHFATLSGGQSITKDVSIKVENTEWKENLTYVFNLAIYGDIVLNDAHISFSINSGSATLPATAETKVTYYPKFTDTVKPNPPLEITQKDFIKSILKMYNLYVYSNIENPKHIILEKYDDYYSDASKLLNSVDWSNKIDYSGDYSTQFNIESNKKYSFSYKEDSDYYNAELYKKRYNLNYGSFVTGEQREEKVELIFSPTPISKVNDTDRIAPFIYKQDTSGTSKVKSNIRILYYNGVKIGQPYNMIDYKDVDLATDIAIYSNCSHLKYVSGDTNYSYISDLNFGLCKEYFSGVDATIYDTPNLYSNYQNLIKEINDPNFLTVEFDMLLNEVDIASLDFKRPVYLSTPNGDGYFKLLEVNYFNSNELSNVKLQKIIV
jgi:hypothetical protein